MSDKPSMAVAYSMKRRSRYAKGGKAGHGPHCAEGCEHLADGGFVDEEEASGYPDDLISRIMRKLDGEHHEAGEEMHHEDAQMANDSEPMADFEPAQYDDEVKDDHLESHYPGSDEIGDEHVEDEDDDLVRRIMKKMSMKDRMPNPA